MKWFCALIVLLALTFSAVPAAMAHEMAPDCPRHHATMQTGHAVTTPAPCLHCPAGHNTGVAKNCCCTGSIIGVVDAIANRRLQVPGHSPILSRPAPAYADVLPDSLPKPPKHS